MNHKTLLSVLIVAMMVSSGSVMIAVDSMAAEMDITVIGEHGEFVDSAGEVYKGGPFTNEIQLTFNPVGGYEFVEWEVSDGCEYTTNLNHITIKTISKDVTVSAVTRNYSTSHGLMGLIDVDNLLTPEESVVCNWSFASANLKRVGNEWEGMPSTPLIVGDTVYVRAGGILYAVDINNGTVKNYVDSPGKVSFYHYISYGGGVIFDTIAHRAYDLELNVLYDLPGNLEYATYYDGYFYGFLKTGTGGTGLFSIYKTSVDMDKDLVNGVKVNLSKTTEKLQVHAMYGQHSPFIMQDGWLFFLLCDTNTGRSGYRAIAAYNVTTEEFRIMDLPGFKGMMWDDGWLTYADGYFYLTAYTAGLFGGVPAGLESKRTSIMWVKFDFKNGQFEEPNYKNILTPNGSDFRGIASGLVIHNGRGYLNVRMSSEDTTGHTDDVGTCMLSYNIGANGEPFVQEAAPSFMTHGGIVVNTAHEDEGKIHIYAIPYDMSAQGIYIFTDELIDGKWVLNEKYSYEGPTKVEWCSQGVRAGPNGEILYYVDRGFIDCYISDYKNTITVLTMDSDSAVSAAANSQNAGITISSMFPGITMGNGVARYGDAKYVLYGLNEGKHLWERIDDPYKANWNSTYKMGVTQAPYHYVALLEEGSSTHFRPLHDNGWYYQADDGTVKKCFIDDPRSIDEALGKQLSYYPDKPTGLVIPNSITVPYMGSVTFPVSADIDWTFTIPDESVVTAVKNPNGSMTLNYVSVGSTSLTITADNLDYNIDVSIKARSTVDEDGYDVITSASQEVLENGHAVDTTVTTKAKGDENILIEDKVFRDESGSPIGTEKTQVISNRQADVDEDGNIKTLVMANNVITDVNGDVIKSVSSQSESTEVLQKDGSVVTTVSGVVKDNLTGEKTKTDTVKTVKDMMEIVSTTVTCDNKTQTSIDARFTSDDKTEIDVTDDSISMNISGEFDLDINSMVGYLDPEGTKDVTVTATTAVSEANVMSAAKAGAVLEYRTPVATISLEANVLNDLNPNGSLVFEAASADHSELTQAQRDAVGTNDVFNLNLRCGDSLRHNFGEFRISLNSDMEEKDGMKVQVWRVDDDGRMFPAEDIVYNDGVLSFSSDHLSVYTVGYVADDSGSGGSSSDSNGNTMLYIGIGAAVLLAALLAVFLVRRRSV